MSDAQKVISSNAINQCAALVGYNRVDPTDKQVLSDGNKPQLDINHIASGLDTRFDDYGLRRKTVQIGTWDMDADGFVNITHSLPPGAWANTRSIELSIINDAADFVHDDNDAEADVSVSGINSTQVVITRTPSGKFDSTDFNGSDNRGHVTIWYE